MMRASCPTNALPLALENHTTKDCVALDELVDQLTRLLVGDRENTSGVGDDGVEMLRRDMRRERNRAVRSVLRVIRADLHKGKSPELVAQFSDALSALIRTHSPDCPGDLVSEIVGETDIECRENPLEMRVLAGDDSRPTMTKLGRIVRTHIQKLTGLNKSINARLYGGM